MSMAHAHILRKSWKSLKKLSMKQLLGLSSGLCMMRAFCVMKMKHGQTIWLCRDELSLATLFWEDIIALLVCLKYYCFYVNIKVLFCILLDLNIHATIKKIALINVLGSIPHKKFCFYHLPTRGRAGNKLGDVDTSPTYL